MGNAASATPVPVPNPSFESPTVPYAGVALDAWQKNPKPPDYLEEDGFTWDQLVGTFKNPAASAANHIDNLDGEQAVWVFAVPDAGLSIDYHSVDWNDGEATHEFDSTFEAGKSYQLTVGVLGGGGGMLEGATIEISLYYHDTQTNVITVTSTTVTHSSALFPTRTHFVDAQLDMEKVEPGDPWAGQRIGISIVSTVSEELQGGYWDLDNVRLSSVRGPTLASPTVTGEGFQFTLLSEPGIKFDVLASEDLTLPIAQWTTIGTFTNDTGTVLFTDEAAASRRFYELREVP